MISQPLNRNLVNPPLVLGVPKEAFAWILIVGGIMAFLFLLSGLAPWLVLPVAAVILQALRVITDRDVFWFERFMAWFGRFGSTPGQAAGVYYYPAG